MGILSLLIFLLTTRCQQERQAAAGYPQRSCRSPSIRPKSLAKGSNERRRAAEFASRAKAGCTGTVLVYLKIVLNNCQPAMSRISVTPEGNRCKTNNQAY